ncbi:MAG: hypothetical protein J2P37_17250 [Ktedonobacteraceae bacterium]|nr:hypothetical protein [Ktedonobacteraceae bacterium]MBO0789842.1 hypothetical protein [Ktedonobacteraceae bacterium]
MGLSFLRGNSQTPKGHAILLARSSSDPGAVYATYCVVPPIPMSLAKYISPLLAAQIPGEALNEAMNTGGVFPIPPMLEEGFSLEQLQALAERRDDDLCDVGSLSSRDEMARMQIAVYSCQEYAQLYSTYMASASQISPAKIQAAEEVSPLDDLDAEELFLQTMPDRQKLTELGKLVGTARYALDGHDTKLLQETKQRMERLARLLAAKYRGQEIVNSAIDPDARGARLAELYISRAFKLLDEEYADIREIENSIRELREQQ